MTRLHSQVSTQTLADDPKLSLPDNGHGLNGVKADKSANGVGSSHDDPKEMSLISRWARKTFTKKQLYRKLPILEWAPKYTLSHFISDAIAGTTVALTVIPQGIAYAIVAGLDPQVARPDIGKHGTIMQCSYAQAALELPITKCI